MKAHPVTWGMTRVVVPAMALVMLTAPAWARAMDDEFQINTFTTDSQNETSVGMDTSVNFVVAGAQPVRTAPATVCMRSAAAAPRRWDGIPPSPFSLQTSPMEARATKGFILMRLSLL